jgi:release factor glutamine methyltransferase
VPDTIARVRSAAREAARREGISPRDVDLLLAELIGRDPVYLVAHDDRVLTTEEASRFEHQLARRLAGEPVQYLLGRCEFYGRSFRVDPRVLIPRPETELVCEHVLRLAAPGMRVIDVGCGSGAIAVTLALEMPDLDVLGSDVSIDAILVARANAQRLGARVRFAAGDLLVHTRERFSLIVSNPPYIPAEDVPGLQREVSLHEPRLALSGGPGGLEVIERLAGEAFERLDPGGSLVLEIGWDQGDRVRQLAGSLGFRAVVHEDLAGLPRCAVLTKP